MDYKFTEAELADFKRFWESEVGKKYLKKMTETKTQLLDAAMSAVDKDYVYRSTAIANGFQSVLLDIKAIIAGVNKKEDKETAEETKQ